MTLITSHIHFVALGPNMLGICMHVSNSWPSLQLSVCIFPKGPSSNWAITFDYYIAPWPGGLFMWDLALHTKRVTWPLPWESWDPSASKAASRIYRLGPEGLQHTHTRMHARYGMFIYAQQRCDILAAPSTLSIHFQYFSLTRIHIIPYSQDLDTSAKKLY